MCSVVKRRKALKSIVYKRITESYVKSTKKKSIKKYRNSRKTNEIDTLKRWFFIENSKIENYGKHYQGRNKSTNKQNQNSQ